MTRCPSSTSRPRPASSAQYANGVKLVLDFLKTPFAERPGWIQNLGTCPVRFVGEEGWVEAGDSGGIEVSSAALKSELKNLEKSPSAGGLDVSAHARNFFDCVKSRGTHRPTPKSCGTRTSPATPRHSPGCSGENSGSIQFVRNSSATPRPTVCDRGPLVNPGALLDDLRRGALQTS